MMKIIKKPIITLAAIIFALACLPPANALCARAVKDESVFARLYGNGDVRGIYIINGFKPGGGEFIDYGKYYSAVNLTDLQTLSVSSEAVGARAGEGNFYYQGNLVSNDLPWLYEIEYELGGAAILPENLAGSSGPLVIRLTSRKNDAVNPVFYDNYMQQITFTLDSERCANIAADGAAEANAGKNRMLAFTVLPGNDAEILITADVTDFEMAGIEINAAPFSMDIKIPDTGEMLDDFNILADAIAELNDGAAAIYDGAAEISSGSLKLADGSAELADGINILGENSETLIDASAQINGALKLIAASLNEPGGQTGMDELARLPQTLALLAEGLKQAEGGMSQLKTGYEAAFAALDGAINEIPGRQIPEAQIRGLFAKAEPEDQALLGALAEAYAAALTAKGTYEAVSPAFKSVAPTLETLISSIGEMSGALTEMSARIGGALSADDTAEKIKLLADGISEISDNYGSFHEGLAAFMSGAAEIAGGYAEIDSGISELADGLAEFADGAAKLRDGTEELASETSGMPGRVKEEIDDLTSDFTAKKFETVSFASERNENIGLVQFVFRTDDIIKPAVEKEIEVENAQSNFWERLKKLFDVFKRE